ncbi:two component transcriptional regulator, winged helix family [Kushneria avicenniae]|uniref:Two component transcriptional regulator, winged helix family n=1 Tax=Kushneria avicenniae TaxID=402385 RepID=A0A1I1JN28_9GAMM|nr:response regulator [Kushneria avicenniae]SFC49785.1 two component transcriptional regulator, winged helix family [Kushneria avicenniae]
MRVLLVEDDAPVAAGIEAGLALSDFVVDTVSTVDGARGALSAIDYDAVVLDRRLPDGEGLTLLQQWRRAGVATPVLMLTARDAVASRVEGLQGGADDYLVKPFDLDELTARLQALLRRSAGQVDCSLRHGRLALDPVARSVMLDGVPVALVRRELMLLEALIRARGRILSADQLKDRLYGIDDEIESNALNVHIYQLRRKLGREAIETVRGIGYRLGPLSADRPCQGDTPS